MIARTRRALLAVVLVAAAFFLSGCIKFDAKIELNDDDTANFTMLLAYDAGQVATVKQSSGIDIAALVEQFEIGGANSVDYADGTFVGKTITQARVPFSDFASGGEGVGGLIIERDGDDYVFEIPGSEQLQGFLGEGFTERDIADLEAAGVLAQITVTFPGVVKEANGEIDGKSVTWNLLTADPEKGLKARGSAEESIVGDWVYMATHPTTYPIAAGLTVLPLLLVGYAVRRAAKGGSKKRGSTPSVPRSEAKRKQAEADRIRAVYGDSPDHDEVRYPESNLLGRRDQGERPGR